MDRWFGQQVTRKLIPSVYCLNSKRPERCVHAFYLHQKKYPFGYFKFYKCVASCLSCENTEFKYRFFFTGSSRAVSVLFLLRRLIT